jgi:hypothetical protein
MAGVVSRTVLPGTGRIWVMVGPRLSREAVGTGPTARAALSRPPVRTLPSRLDFLSTVFRSFDLICASSSAVFWLLTRAATSATWGVAIEVPL